MAFALAAVAGVFAGLTLNIFFVCALVAPLFASVVLIDLSEGVFGAFCKAATIIGALQLGYMTGLVARSNRQAQRRLEVAASTDIVKK